MSEISRRGFLGTAAAVTGAAAIGAAIPGAAAAAPGTSRTAKRHGDIRDIKHVVIVMQENRSFDHWGGNIRRQSVQGAQRPIAVARPDFLVRGG